MALLGFLFQSGPKLKIGEVEVEVCLSESHENAATVTMNPVEDGVDVTDHVQLQPKRLTIEGAVSNTPIRFLSGFRSGLTSGFGEDTRSYQLYRELEQILIDKTPVFIETGFDNYENMICTSLRVPRDSNTGSAIRFTAEFQEIVTVTSSLIPIPAGLGGTKTNLGKVQPKPAAPSAAGRGSILAERTGLGG